MRNEDDHEHRYTRAVAAAVQAGRDTRGWTVDELSKQSGIPVRTLWRLIHADQAANVTQLAMLAQALGMTPSGLLADAEQRLTGPELPTDPRALIRYLLDHPEADSELNARLSEATSQTGISGSALAKMRDEIAEQRSAELSGALAALPPSAEHKHA